MMPFLRYMPSLSIASLSEQHHQGSSTHALSTQHFLQSNTILAALDESLSVTSAYRTQPLYCLGWMVLCCGKLSVLMGEGHGVVGLFAGLISSRSARKWIVLYFRATCWEPAGDVMQMSVQCLVPQGHIWLKTNSHQEAFIALWVESNAHRSWGLYANIYSVLRLYRVTAYLEATRNKKKENTFKHKRNFMRLIKKSDDFFLARQFSSWGMSGVGTTIHWEGLCYCSFLLPWSSLPPGGASLLAVKAGHCCVRVVQVLCVWLPQLPVWELRCPLSSVTSDCTCCTL